MNVSVQHVREGPQIKKKILVAAKDFEAGDVIYKEEPIVAVLDSDLQKQGSHCSHCLRHIQKGMAIKPESDRLGSVYCSKECQVKAKAQSQNLLFGLEAFLPPELGGVMDLPSGEDREKAVTMFVEHLKSQEGRAAPLMVARFIARQLTIETAKMLPKSMAGVAPPKIAERGDYSLYDHLQRLRFVDAKVTQEETKVLRDTLRSALPGLEQSVTDEQHAIYMGKVAYNAFGICYAGGRDDRPVFAERPEDQERTRTPYGTSRQIGSGLYIVSAYIAHSCDPSARPSFSTGTSELHLIATRPIKKGDEITVSYVDVAQHADESPEQARRRRRMELARGWRFKCECSRCLLESAQGAENDLGVEKDESKVEEIVKRLEEGIGGPSFGPQTSID